MGWGGTITSLQLRSLLDIRAVTLNMASSSDAVGWGGVGQRPCSCVPSFDPLAATLNMASSSDAVGWGGVGWGGVGWDNVLAAAFHPRHMCCHTQHGIVFRCCGVGRGGVGQKRPCSCVPSFDPLAATLNMTPSSDSGPLCQAFKNI